MPYSNIDNTICYGDVKHAALFFDGVVPLNCVQWLDMDANEGLKNRIYADLLCLKDLEVSKQQDVILDFIRKTDYLFRMVDGFHNLLGWDVKSGHCSSFMSELYTNPEDLKQFANIFGYIYSGFRNETQLSADGMDWTAVFATYHLLDIKGSGFRFLASLSEIISELPVVTPHISLTLPPTTSDLFSPQETDLTLMLSRIRLIDTSRLAWDTILDIRNNPEAKRKLRNLRLFLHNNYVGRSKAFIEDDISRRLEEYEDTCRAYHLDTRLSTFSALMSSKSLLATTTLSMCAVLLGEPLVASSALASGVSIEIGKICIEAAKRRHAFNLIEKHHQLAYLANCKREMTSQPLKVEN